MKEQPAANITVSVDVTNPGQFFACCGLLELADRLWPGAEGWFEEEMFRVVCGIDLASLIDTFVKARFDPLAPDDETASPLCLSKPFDLALDWWVEGPADAKALKVWAGRMSNLRIVRAMQAAMGSTEDLARMFDHTAVVFDPENPKKKVEPFYFDARRGWNAQSIDLGFAPDSLNMQTTACPAVESLCLVGLQRFRPAATEQRRVFDYTVWQTPLPASIAAAAAGGALGACLGPTFRFENAFRTSQRKHKSFLPATPLGAHE